MIIVANPKKFLRHNLDKTIILWMLELEGVKDIISSNTFISQKKLKSIDVKTAGLIAT